jgi:hypothetical protein
MRIVLVAVAVGVVAFLARKRLGRLVTRVTGTWIGSESP